MLVSVDVKTLNALVRLILESIVVMVENARTDSETLDGLVPRGRLEDFI